MIRPVCSVLLIAALFACFSCDRPSTGASQPATAPSSQLVAINPADLDTSISPAADFYKYADDKWIASHPIPPDQTGWGTFQELQQRSQQQLKGIADELLAEPNNVNGYRQQVRDFYATATDAAKLNTEGARPLDPDLAAIAAMKTPADLVPVVTHLQLVGASPFFGVDISPDLKDSQKYAFYINQAGTLLPERGYYLNDDPDSRKIREAYREHIMRMFMLLGQAEPAATASADTVLRIETSLAEKQMTPVQLRDPEPQYNKMTTAKLAELAPAFDWTAYFRILGIPQIKEVIVAQPDFLKRMNQLIKETSPADLQTYLRWHLISTAAPRLSDPFVEESFRFFGQTLAGAKQLKPRWQRAVEAENSVLPEAIGRLYVEKYFSPQAKQHINRLVDNIMAAYAQRIQSLDWMGPETKAKALVKLKAVQRKLGYPDKWRDYSALTINRDSYVQNYFRARDFDMHYWLSKLFKPVDRTEWFMSPSTVNAYYNPTMNEIVFPAAILQPPFFNPNADDALNYGAIGAVIGHELTHGFDDQGRKFDAKGNMVNWWTPQDKERFEARTKKLVQQFDACVVMDDLHVNGQLTLGENIADLGGVTISFDAYHRSLGGKPAPVINGLSGDQRFFISYAFAWRDHRRPAVVRLLLRTDPHSPPRFRVDVPLSNLVGFYKAFDVKAGDAMYRAPGDRAEVW